MARSWVSRGSAAGRDSQNARGSLAISPARISISAPVSWEMCIETGRASATSPSRSNGSCARINHDGGVATSTSRRISGCVTRNQPRGPSCRSTWGRTGASRSMRSDMSWRGWAGVYQSGYSNIKVMLNPNQNRQTKRSNASHRQACRLAAAFAIRRCIIMRAIAFRKMRRAGETTGQRHVDHAHIRLHQQIARLLQTQLHIIPFR